MIYELRIYRCVPGCQPALLSRFENETLRIWEGHGIRQAGFWTTLIGRSSQEIIYAKDIQDILRIQMAFVRSQLEAFGEQAKDLGEAYIKAVSGQTTKPPRAR
jgi:hypothetical protein